MDTRAVSSFPGSAGLLPPKTPHSSPHAPESPSGITSVRGRTILLLLSVFAVRRSERLTPFIVFFTANDLYHGAIYRLPLLLAPQHLSGSVTGRHGQPVPLPLPPGALVEDVPGGGVLFNTIIVAPGAVSSLAPLEIGAEAPMSGKELGQMVILLAVTPRNSRPKVRYHHARPIALAALFPPSALLLCHGSAPQFVPPLQRVVGRGPLFDLQVDRCKAGDHVGRLRRHGPVRGNDPQCQPSLQNALSLTKCS